MRSDISIPDPVIELFHDTLDRPIAFHPVFVDLTRSVTAGLLLSQAVYWTKRVTSGDWFYKTMKQWEEETRLSRHEQESARKILRHFSFWQEERRGVPAQMYFRVDIAALYYELLSLKEAKGALSRLPESGKLDSRKAEVFQRLQQRLLQRLRQKDYDNHPPFPPPYVTRYSGQSSFY